MGLTRCYKTAVFLHFIFLNNKAHPANLTMPCPPVSFLSYSLSVPPTDQNRNHGLYSHQLHIFTTLHSPNVQQQQIHFATFTQGHESRYKFPLITSQLQEIAKNVQLWQIGSWPLALQRAIDGVHMLPQGPQRVAQEVIFCFFLNKIQFQSKSPLQSFFVWKLPAAKLLCNDSPI